MKKLLLDFPIAKVGHTVTVWVIEIISFAASKNGVL
jgi:hypothetical protein